jgi:hypothetical protein
LVGGAQRLPGGVLVAWCDAHLDDPALDWMELSKAGRAMWQRIATKVGERIHVAAERSHALGNYLPPPRCRAKRRDRSTLYRGCRRDPIRPTPVPMTNLQPRIWVGHEPQRGLP